MEQERERLFCMHASAYVRIWLTYVLGKMCVDGTAAFTVRQRTIRFVGRLCYFAYDCLNAKGNKICSNRSNDSTSLKRHYSTIINQYIQNVWSIVRSQFLHQYSTYRDTSYQYRTWALWSPDHYPLDLSHCDHNYFMWLNMKPFPRRWTTVVHIQLILRWVPKWSISFWMFVSSCWCFYTLTLSLT